MVQQMRNVNCIYDVQELLAFVTIGHCLFIHRLYIMGCLLNFIIKPPSTDSGKKGLVHFRDRTHKYYSFCHAVQKSPSNSFSPSFSLSLSLLSSTFCIRIQTLVDSIGCSASSPSTRAIDPGTCLLFCLYFLFRVRVCLQCLC